MDDEAGVKLLKNMNFHRKRGISFALKPEELSWLLDEGIAEMWASHWRDDDNPKAESTYGVHKPAIVLCAACAGGHHEHCGRQAGVVKCDCRFCWSSGKAQVPEDRYRNDVTYATMVNTLESFIHQAQMTPSEIRECALLACIHYEQHRPFPSQVFPIEVLDAIETINGWRSGK